MNENQPLKPLTNMQDLQEDNLIIETSDNNDPVGRLVNRVILKGLTKQASEIHFEPQTDCLKIYFCQDGVLMESLNPLNKAISDTLISRLKSLANFKKNSQEGNFSKNIQGNQINFWLNVMPTPLGIKAILRWWNINKANFNLDELIYHQDSLKLIKTIAHRSSGLLLVTGQENSGKLTTLYALLQDKKQAGLTISTIENRLKYSLPNIKQTEIISSDILSYNEAIEEAIVQNIDVILVDNFNKEKNALMIMKAAINNSLILSSLNISNIDEAVCQLLKMGIKPSIVAKTLNGVINQRLLRRICPHCRLEYKPSDIQLHRFGIAKKDDLKLYHANNTESNDCSYCQGMGYKGQIAIYEVLPIKKQLREIIAEKPPLESLKKIIRQQKFTHLLDYALDLVMSGETTFAEVERVLPDTLEDIKIIVPTDSISNSPSKNLLKLEEKLETNSSKSLPEKEVQINNNYEERLTKLEQEIAENYGKKFKLLEKQIAKLTKKVQNLQQDLDLYVSLGSNSSPKIEENLEELIIEDYDFNFNEELTEKESIKNKKLSTKKIEKSQKESDNLILDKDDINLTLIHDSSHLETEKLISENASKFQDENIEDPW